MSDLTSSEHKAMLEEIEHIDDVDVCIQKIKQILALKTALESVDRFREQSVKYARLEAAALIRVVELGGMNQLPKRLRSTAEWLSDMNVEERAEYIAMCSDGATIDYVYMREVGDPIKLAERIRAAETVRKDALCEVKEYGIVDLSEYNDRVKKALGREHKQTADDMIDGMRRHLLRGGAVGVGDGSRVFVMPMPENEEAVKDAIITRFKSVCHDMQSIKEISKKSGVKVSYEDLGVKPYSGARTGHLWVSHLAIALASMGVLSDNEEFLTEAVESDFAEEIKWAKTTLGISRRNFIKKQYEKEFGAAAQV